MPATTIFGPGNTSGIDNAFSNIFGMLGPAAPTGGGSGQSGIQFQNPFSGNDLTQEDRSLRNLIASTGAGLGQIGQNLLPVSLGVTQGGLDLSQAGFGTTLQGLATMQPSTDFLSGILANDPSVLASILGGPTTTLSNQAAAQKNMLDEGIQGGFTALSRANLPTEQQALVEQAIGNLKMPAAQLLGQQGLGIAGVGASQAGIGQGIAGTGLGIGGMGTNLIGQGLSGLTAADQSALQKMQLNLQEPSPFQDIMKALSVAGPLLTGIGGLVSGGGAGAGSSSANLASLYPAGFPSGGGNLNLSSLYGLGT